MNKKYHYIYKITRFDGKYYIGLHSTDKLDDGYFGSGERLWKSINYHGKDKHTKEILEFFDTRKDLIAREKELVTLEKIKVDENILNLVPGGAYFTRRPDSIEGKRNRQLGVINFYSDLEKSKTAREKISQAHKGRIATDEAILNMQVAARARMAAAKENGTWEVVKEKNRQKHLGKTQTAETIQKRNESIRQFKEKNGKRKFSDIACENIARSLLGSERNAKIWEITDVKTGLKIEIKNLQKWLKDKDLVTTRDRKAVKKYLNKEILFSIVPAEKQIGSSV